MLETRLAVRNIIKHYFHFDFETLFFLISLNFEF